MDDIEFRDLFWGVETFDHFVNRIWCVHTDYCYRNYKEEDSQERTDSILSIFDDWTGRCDVMVGRKQYKGSTVVEMSYLAPVVLLVWMAVIFGLFYYHDKGVLTGASYETAVVTSELWNADSKEKQSQAETYFVQRIQGKMLFFGGAEMECIVDDDKITIKAKASKKNLSMKVEESAAVTKPEETVRNLKVLKERIEDNIE